MAAHLALAHNRLHLDKRKYEQETSQSNEDSKVYQSTRHWSSTSMSEWKMA